MDKNLQNIEDLFKKGLEGIKELPSEKVWNEDWFWGNWKRIRR